nr:unnamed protein product [Callosobruchus analis]
MEFAKAKGLKISPAYCAAISVSLVQGTLVPRRNIPLFVDGRRIPMVTELEMVIQSPDTTYLNEAQE